MPPGAPGGTATVLLGLTAVFAILSGIGTSCVAWGAANYEPFASLAPYGWLFQSLVFVNVLVGGAGVAEALLLVRRRRTPHTRSLALLMIFLATAVVQMYYSSSLREVSFFATPPTNIRFIFTSAVMVYFLVLRAAYRQASAVVPVPGFGASQRGAFGAFLLTAGTAIVTTPVWAGAGHMIDGYNFTDILLLPLSLTGGILIVGGVGMLARGAFVYAGSPHQAVRVRATENARSQEAEP